MSFNPSRGLCTGWTLSAFAAAKVVAIYDGKVTAVALAIPVRMAIVGNGFGLDFQMSEAFAFQVNDSHQSACFFSKIVASLDS